MAGDGDPKGLIGGTADRDLSAEQSGGFLPEMPCDPGEWILGLRLSFYGRVCSDMGGLFNPHGQ